jgi:putative addiction module component (TIGR02574 family)
MSHEELIAEILRLPHEEQQQVLEGVVDHWAAADDVDPDMTPEFRAELERRDQDLKDHPENGSSWEEVSARLLARKPTGI